MPASHHRRQALDDGIDAERALRASLFSPEARIDPHPFFRSVNLPGCRYRIAETMLRDRRFGPPRFPASQEPFWQMFHRWLINLDGERHVRLRRLFAGLFTPRNVDGFRSVVRRTAEELVEAVWPDGAMDLVAEFARPLPFSVIVGILGVPPERREWLRQRMFVLGQGFAHQDDPAHVTNASVAVTEMLDYYSALLEERAAEPRQDLLSALAMHVQADDEARQDVLANCVFFVEAGHVTTTSLISGGMLLLLEHPDERGRLSREPDLVPAAVEETLRLVTPVSAVICEAREHVEADGYVFVKGSRRFVFLGAANRDPDRYAEPDRFDIGRSDVRHLAFSAGGHFCLGAPLARLHGEVATRVLLARLPGLRLAGEPVWRGSLPLRELEHLPVAWETGPGALPESKRNDVR